MTTVYTNHEYYTGMAVRVVNRKLPNGKPGVAITLTVDADVLADLELITQAVSQVASPGRGNPLGYFRTILADAIRAAMAYKNIPRVARNGVHFKTPYNDTFDTIYIEPRS